MHVADGMRSREALYTLGGGLVLVAILFIIGWLGGKAGSTRAR
jgi:hypothetical protein